MIRKTLIILLLMCGVARADVSFVEDTQASTELTNLMIAYKPYAPWSWGVQAFTDSRGAFVYFSDHTHNDAWSGGWLAKRNDGDGTWANVSVGATIDGPRENQPLGFDVNNDGFIDIVHTGDESSDAGGYESQGDGSYIINDNYKSRRPLPGGSIADFNSDGFLDVRWYEKDYGVTTQRTTTNNAGASFSWSSVEVPRPAGLPAAVTAKLDSFVGDTSDTKNRYAGPMYFEGDIDNDGDSDVMVTYGGSYGGAAFRYTRLCLRDSQGVLQEVSPATSGIPDLAVVLTPMVDLNGDGLLDFISQYSSGGVYLQTSPGVFARQAVGGNFHTEMATGTYLHWWYDYDLDGDGDKDLVITCRRSRTAFILDNQSGTFVLHKQIAHADGEPLDFFDYDNDGDLDIVCWGNNTEKMSGASGQSTRSVTMWQNQASGSPPPADTTPPTVTGTIPANGVTDVVIDMTPSVTFSEDVNASTVNGTNVRLLQGATPVASTVSLSNRVATITPDDLLSYETVYTISVDNVEDTSANAMAAEFTASFTTVEEPTTPDPPDPPTINPHTGITILDELSADQTDALLTGKAFSITITGPMTGGAVTYTFTIDGAPADLTVTDAQIDVTDIPDPPTPPSIGSIPLPDLDVTSANWNRWKNHIDSQGGGRAEDYALLYAVTGQESYQTEAITRAQARVTNDTVAGNQYLQAGPQFSDVFKTLAWCDVPTEQANQWLAWGLGHLGETDGSVTDSIWWTNRWSRNNPANNYYHSFITATSVYAMAAQDTEWLTWLKNDRLPRMYNYYNTTPEGGSREGTGYGESHRSVFVIAKLWRDYDGTEVLPQTFINNSLHYWAHATCPGQRWVALIGDHTRTHGSTDGYHRDIIDNALAVATDSEARAIGRWLINRLPVSTNSVFFDLELRDHPDTGHPPNETEYYAAGAGHFFARDSWSNDATYVYCTAGIHDEAHQQEDQGAFAVWANGRYQTCSDSPWTNGGIAQSSQYQNVVRFAAVQNIKDQAGTLVWLKNNNVISVDMNLTEVTGFNWQRRLYWAHGADFLVIRDWCDPQYPFTFNVPSEDDDRAPYVSAATADTASSTDGHITIIEWPETE